MASKEAPTIGWEENVIMCAQRFSSTMEERFGIEVQACRTFIKESLPEFLPKDRKILQGNEKMARALEYLLEYMLGTAVAVGGHYCSTSPEFEENIVALVRDKFSKVRKMKEEGTFNAISEQSHPRG
jgi:hypothetical protein